MSGTYPDYPLPRTMGLRSVAPTFVSVAANLSRQSRSRGAQRFAFDLEYAPGWKWREVSELMGFLAGQRGQADTFTFTPRAFFNRGTMAGTPVVDGGSQTGTTVNVRGMTPNAQRVIAVGDFVKFAGHDKVYWATADLNADGSGDGALSIYPLLLASPNDGAAISGHTEASPLSFTCAVAGDTIQTQIEPGGFTSFSVELVEVV